MYIANRMDFVLFTLLGSSFKQMCIDKLFMLYQSKGLIALVKFAAELSTIYKVTVTNL